MHITRVHYVRKKKKPESRSDIVEHLRPSGIILKDVILDKLKIESNIDEETGSTHCFTVWRAPWGGAEQDDGAILSAEERAATVARAGARRDGGRKAGVCRADDEAVLDERADRAGPPQAARGQRLHLLADFQQPIGRRLGPCGAVARDDRARARGRRGVREGERLHFVEVAVDPDECDISFFWISVIITEGVHIGDVVSLASPEDGSSSDGDAEHLETAVEVRETVRGRQDEVGKQD